MDIIEFSTPVKYNPNLLCIPEAYVNVSFSNIDFSNDKSLKDFLIEYLKAFTIVSAQGFFDSLLLCPGEKAFNILVAIYREVGSRITVDHYRFMDWPAYVSELKGMGWQAEKKLHEDLEDVRFIFVFDLNFLHKESINYFCELLDFCHTHRVRMFIATRDLSIMEKLPESYYNLSKQKLYLVKINEGAK